jgi:tetratricopeptide (TPR) repeat protein
VWNLVAGVVSGFSKTGQAPTSSQILKTDNYLTIRFSGKGNQGAERYRADTYVLFADSHSFIVKAFTAGEEINFSMAGWDFGKPLGKETEVFAGALGEIKARLDSGRSLLRAQALPTVPTPGEKNTKPMDDPDAIEGQQALQRKDGSAALKAFTKVEGKFPENSLVSYWLGRSYGMLHNKDMAVQSYERAIKINPQNALAWMYLGSSLIETDPVRAIKACRKATELQPDVAETWWILGLCYLSEKQVSSAVSVLERAVKMKPDFAEAWYSLGGAYLAIGDQQRSSDAYAKSSRLKEFSKSTPVQNP